MWHSWIVLTDNSLKNKSNQNILPNSWILANIFKIWPDEISLKWIKPYKSTSKSQLSLTEIIKLNTRYTNSLFNLVYNKIQTLSAK
jgi:hypothetical protein